MLGTLVRDLGWLAETESDELQLTVEPCSIEQLLTAELARWQQQAEMDRITLSLQLPPDPPDLNLDPMRMSQALGNVIDNALRHTQAGGQVEVAATIEAGRQLTILVTDDGAGISAVDLPHVVDRFYRADRSRSRLNPKPHSNPLMYKRKLVPYGTSRAGGVRRWDRRGAKPRDAGGSAPGPQSRGRASRASTRGTRDTWPDTPILP